MQQSLNLFFLFSLLWVEFLFIITLINSNNKIINEKLITYYILITFALYSITLSLFLKKIVHFFFTI